MHDTPEFSPDPSVAPAVSPRWWTGWVALITILVLFIVGALSSSFRPSDPAASAVTRLESTLGRMLLNRASKVVDRDFDKDVRDSLRELKSYAGTATGAQALLVIQREIGDDPDPRALATLSKSKEKAEREFGAYYGAKKIEPNVAAARAADWRKNGSSLFKLARAQALVAAGKVDEAEADAKVARTKMIAMGLVLMASVGGGIIVWVLFGVYGGFARISKGAWPVGTLSLHDADRAAGRVAMLLGSYVVVDFLPESLGWMRVLVMMTLIAGALFVPIAGHRIEINRFFRFSESKGRLVLWVFGTELALAPVAVILVLVGVVFSKFLPPPSHPASEILTDGATFLTILSVFFQAVVFAPIVEEIIFRGLLCPAISRVLNPMAGVLISSFAFAMIHPQGVLGWLPLAAFGAMSALLSRATRSLVPSMLMHALHNATLLTLTLWNAS